MSEAEFLGMLVLALTTLIGLFSAVYKPLKNHTEAMTENTCQLKNLTKSFDEFEKHNKESHQKLWEHNNGQDGLLDMHEQRLHEIDGKWSHEK